MSGGSYDYLCFKDPCDIISCQNAINSMFDRLSTIDGAEDAARETYELALVIKQYQTKVEVLMERLRPVFKAVEWSDSGDWAEHKINEALSNYRA